MIYWYEFMVVENDLDFPLYKFGKGLKLWYNDTIISTNIYQTLSDVPEEWQEAVEESFHSFPRLLMITQDSPTDYNHNIFYPSEGTIDRGRVDDFLDFLSPLHIGAAQGRTVKEAFDLASPIHVEIDVCP